MQTITEETGLMVVKRNGEVVEFDSTKIRAAIAKAIIATKERIEQGRIDRIVEEITKELEVRFTDFFPNIENVQDIVENHLFKNELYTIAKAYVIYREQRHEARELKKKEVLHKSTVGKLKVKKSDGTIVIFDTQKAGKTLTRAISGFENDISQELILNEAVKNIYDGVTTEEIEKALIFSTIAFIEKDPSYGYVAGRLFMQKLYKEVIGKSITDGELDSNYRQAFIKGITEGVDNQFLDKQMLDFNLEKLSKGLMVNRDELFQYIGIQTLYERYFIKNGKRRIELPQSFWMRVAMGLAINETNKEEKALEFYGLLSSMSFVSSTPTLFHAGTIHPQLSSCYLTTVEDDLGAIFKSLGDNAQLSKWSGGLGNDWSNIRATGSYIKSTKVESQGVIPFLKIANDVTVAINRSGKRRGATCAYLESWHLDIEDFLDLRKNTGDDRRRTHDMNTANWIPDLFMKRMIADKDWTLFSPEEVPELHHIYGKEFEKRYEEYEEKAKNGQMKMHKTIPAKKLWRKMISMLFETGHPWITFKDPCNIRSPQDHVGVVHNSNLCTEITLNTSTDETAVCNLGSVNLTRHIIDGKLDKEMVEKTIRIAIRMLDNVVDLNFYPTDEAKNSNMKHRPIGLGIMGFQDALYLLDHAFDSPEAMKFADESMELISYYAILCSSELAREKGAYESYKGSKWGRNLFPIDTFKIMEQERGIPTGIQLTSSLDWTPVREHVKLYGMRNSNVMAIAPTATISNIAGSFPCIEPIYKNIYVKANISGEFTVVNKYLIDDLKKLNLWNQEMLEQLKYHDGNLQIIGSIPQKLKDKYKEAFAIDPSVVVNLAAVRNKWIDQSQSINIFMQGTSGKKLDEIYTLAWKRGLKTTYYLRSLAASQIEKSTLDAKKFGYTQKREYRETEGQGKEAIATTPASSIPTRGIVTETPKPTIHRDDDANICEACQ